jgi:hypothetical protein
MRTVYSLQNIEGFTEGNDFEDIDYKPDYFGG